MSPDEKFIDSIKQAYFLFARRPDGTITSVSPTVKPLLGYDRDEFTAVCKASLPRYPKGHYDTLLSESNDGEILIPPYEIQITHKDSTPHWLKITEIPIVSQDGDIVSIEYLAHDITGHKLLEKNLFLTLSQNILDLPLRELYYVLRILKFYQAGDQQCLN